MRAPIIRVSAVALIALFSLTLTSCTAHTGGGSASNSPAASAGENGTQAGAQSETSQGSSPTASTQSATANTQGGGMTHDSPGGNPLG